LPIRFGVGLNIGSAAVDKRDLSEMRYELRCERVVPHRQVDLCWLHHILLPPCESRLFRDPLQPQPILSYAARVRGVQSETSHPIAGYLVCLHQSHGERLLLASCGAKLLIRPFANDYLGSYDHFGLFCHIDNSTKTSDHLAFFIFFTFKGLYPSSGTL